jgi:chemotaxis protein methyltransferase CheR
MTVSKETVLDQRDLSRLRERIAAYSGLDASVLSDDALQQAVARRLTAHALQRIEQYWPLVLLDSGERAGANGLLQRSRQRSRQRSDEIQQLVQTLTNKETFFFREGHHFEALHNEILPALLAPDQRGAFVGRRPLRIWSAGCATGEEPYSLAITLLEYRARHGFFEAEILATDIDEAALHTARRGCYSRRSLRLVPDEAKRRYFHPQGQSGEEQGWCVLPEVAKLVTFRRYNLIEEAPPVGWQQSDAGKHSDAGFDLVFCRNVSIYFHPAARDRLNARLSAALRPGGYLFVASAETMGHNQGRLELVSLGNTFLFRKPLLGQAVQTSGAARGSAAAAVSAATRVSEATRISEATWVSEATRIRGATAAVDRPAASREPAPPAGTRAGARAPGEADPLAEAVRAFERHEFEAALQHLDRLTSTERERLDIRCLQAAILVQREELREAELLCQEVLARDPWHADAHFLLGLTYRQRGQWDAAIQSLKQAIYLYPGHRDAHFFLAETYRTLGLEAQARREYENTLNILATSAKKSGRGKRSDRGEPPTGPQSGSSPRFHLTGLADQALHHACQVNLRNLTKRPAVGRR